MENQRSRPADRGRYAANSMNLHSIKSRLESKGIFLSEDSLCGRPTVIGYEKRFRWRWFATQLNTFVVAADYGDETLTVQSIEALLSEAFSYAKKHYTGWPRGFQSGVGTIAILLSSSIDDDAIKYCRELKAGKKWAGFAVPVAIGTSSNETFVFDRNPMWGRIYYPHFKKIVEDVVS